MRMIRSPGATRDGAINLALISVVVFAWSTSWIALKAQTGVVAPEVSVFLRFLAAAPLVFVWAWVSGARLSFGRRAHLAFAAMGVAIFSSNFILFYHGAAHLPSGLLSVIFALASVVNVTLAFFIFGEKAPLRVLVGGLTGFAGVALMFEPEFERAGAGADILAGLGFCTAGTLAFSIGNMISSRLQKRAIPVVGASAWGMLYGALWSLVLALARGAAFTVEWTWPYLGGLAWLVIVSTVIAFITYLSLLGRVGAGRAGYATVLFPVFALIISAAFENFRPTALTWAGLILVAAGNVLMLSRQKAADHGGRRPVGG